MQPSASGSFSKTLQNPTVLAMLGSAGVHIILVIISALKPAEGQPQRFQIVNLPPKASTNKTVPKPGDGSNLPVPNGLPPISLGDIPEMGALPDFSSLRPPSQSFFTGSNSGFGFPSIDPNQLRIRNPPQQSFPNPLRPKSTSPMGLNGVPSLQPPNTAQLPTLNSSESSSSTRFDSNNKQFSANNSKLSSLSKTSFSARDALNELYGQQSSSSSETSPALSNVQESENTDSSLAETRAIGLRKNFDRWLQAQSVSNVQQMSAQKGPQLTAAYPIEACGSQQSGTAVVAAVYGPDGSISSQSGAVQVLESAPNQAMNQAAIAAVSAYRPEPKKVPQAFTFTVDIPYSSAVCTSAQPKSSPKSSPSASPSPTSKSPKPLATPSSPPSQPPQGSSPKPARPAAAPSSSPSPSIPASSSTPSTVPQTPSASPSVMMPESPSASPSSSASPSPIETAPSSPSVEPLPSPSISVPESTPAPAAPENTSKP